MTPMNFMDLTPEFVRHETRDGRQYLVYVNEITEAQSVEFMCPTCFQRNGGSKGTHWVMVTFVDRGVPDDQGSQSTSGKPSRWRAHGTGLQDLTLAPSIDLTPGCDWHGFVRDGQVT